VDIFIQLLTFDIRFLLELVGLAQPFDFVLKMTDFKESKGSLVTIKSCVCFLDNPRIAKW
jgi:hypothetical protein